MSTPDKFDGSALGTRIKLLREMRGMTLQAVGDAAGLTKSHVWELEQGRAVNPTVNAVWGLSAALSVSPAMLLGLDDRMPPLDPFALKIAGIVDREIKRVCQGWAREAIVLADAAALAAVDTPEMEAVS